MPDASPVPSDRIVTIPNLLSLVRLALIPLFLGFLLTKQDPAALATLLAASVTDFLDGFLARRLNQVSRLGAVLDPIADRLCIIAAAVGLAFREILPWWLVLIVFARDLALLVVAGVLATHNIPIVPVSRIGKLATALLLAALPVLVFAATVPATAPVLLPIGLVVAIVGAALYWTAGIGYALATRSLIHEQRNDTPMPSVTLATHEEAPDGR